MRKVLLISILSLFVGFSVNAQETEKVKNWYIEAGGGAQLLFSSDADNLDFDQRITPAISLTGGKWFSPFWGVRLQVGGYALNGYSTPSGLYLANPLSNGSIYGQKDPVRDEVTIRPDGSYRHYLRYVNAHIDFQVSLFSLFKGEDNSRRWDIIPAIGIGYFRTFEYKGTPVTNNISNNASLMGKFNVYKNLDINLEAFASFLPGDFDGRITNKRYEFNTGLTLGVTYNFKTTKKSRKCPDTTPSIQVVTEIVRDTVTVEKLVETIKTEKREPFTLASVRFDLAKTTPIADQDIQFINIANYMKANPNAKLLLNGFGDIGTGTPNINMEISVKRAETVRDILVNQYGVASQRIELKGLGVEQQPYEKNDLNRVVVVIAKD